MTYRTVPLQLKEANNVVDQWHRHHAPCTGHRFSIGAIDDTGTIVGVLIAGRPVARWTDQRMTLEVSRIATNGARNCCSYLLGAAARIAKQMGFCRIQTYTLHTESGASLRGAGWICEQLTAGGLWKHSDGPRRNDQPTCPKYRWIKELNACIEYAIPERQQQTETQVQLWGVS